jgi:hypothetical protein
MKGRDRMVLMGIIVLVVAAAGWMLLVSPERKEAKSVEAKVASAKSELATAEGQLSDARNAENQYGAAYTAVVKLGKAVPPSSEVPSLIYELSSATDTGKVEFNSIVSGGTGSATATTATSATTPAAGATAAPSATASTTSSAATTAATATTAAFTPMPFTFIFNGGFFDLEHLFRSLTSFTNYSSSGALEVNGRLLTIESVKLLPAPSEGGKASNQLTGTITASAYVLPSGQELTNGATASSPTGAAPAAATASPSTTSPAIVRVNP